MSPTGAYSGHSSFLPYLINRVTILLNQEFQKELDGSGLTLTQWRVLAFLNERDGLSVNALADATVTEQSTLSRAVASMEQRGLVAKRSRPEDSRVAEIFLAETGRALFAAVLDRALVIDARATSGISEAELGLVNEVLWRMTANLQERVASGA